MKRIITFLGVSAKETRYEYKGKYYSGRLFPEALRQFVDYDEMLVFATEEAQKKTWPILESLGDEHILKIPIEEGKNAVQMWDWFDKILEHVEYQDTVIFDITHGLRSIPFLVFVFAAYLKAARQVRIEAIYYGAFELGDQTTGKPAPVIDLSEFVTMFDWLAATEQFTQTGNADRLSNLINPARLTQGPLFEAESILSAISQSARLCQPFTLMQEAGKLEKVLDATQKELESIAPPFGVLKGQIVDTFGQFQTDTSNTHDMLRTEFRLIEWYYEKGQIVQAITLAREWLIDAVTYRLGQPIDYLLENRRPFELAISGLALLGKPHPEERERKFTEDDLNRWGLKLLEWPEPERDRLKRLWTNLKNVRNPLDHAEHQRKKEKQKTLDALRKLQRKIEEKIVPDLRALAQDWHLVDENDLVSK